MICGTERFINTPCTNCMCCHNLLNSQYKFIKAQYQKSFHLKIVSKKCLFVPSSFQWRMDELSLQIWMIIKCTHLRKWRLRNAVERSPDEFTTTESCDSRRCANPVRFARQGIITAAPRDSRAFANLVGRSPGSLAKRRKHCNAPVSGATFCCKSPTKPVGSNGVAQSSLPPKVLS